MKQKIVSYFMIVFVNMVAASSGYVSSYHHLPSQHGHRGLLKKFLPHLCHDVKFDENEEKTLEKGHALIKEVSCKDEKSQDTHKVDVCVQDIRAPKDAVLSQILDLENYIGKAPKVTEAQNYNVSQNEDGSFNIKTRFKASIMPGYKYTYFVYYIFNPEHNTMTWSLDYDRPSDFDDMVGYMRVESHPSKPGFSRLFYGFDVKLKMQIPKVILESKKKKMLSDGPAWVKQATENFYQQLKLKHGPDIDWFSLVRPFQA